MAVTAAAANTQQDSIAHVAHFTKDLVLRQLRQQQQQQEHDASCDNGDDLTRAETLSLNLVLTQPGYKIHNASAPHIWQQLTCLRSLDLSQNALTDLQCISGIRSLTSLDAAHNRLTSLGGIGKLTQLTSLSLSGNMLQRLPVAMGSLLALEVLALDGNRLHIMSDISRLKPLHNLTALSLRGNPLSALPHARALTVHTLTCLATLHGTAITEEERSSARERFHTSGAVGSDMTLLSNDADGDAVRSRAEAAEAAAVKAQAAADEEGAKGRSAARDARRLSADLRAAEQLLEARTQELASECNGSSNTCWHASLAAIRTKLSRPLECRLRVHVQGLVFAVSA